MDPFRAIPGSRAIWLAWGTTILAASLLAGCGSGGGGSSSSTTNPAESARLAKSGAPPVTETFDQAKTRITNIIATGNCTEINALSLLATAAADNTPEHCRSLESIKSLQELGAAGYGNEAGVIDYAAGDHVLSMILLRDTDGLFHVAFVSPFNGQTTVNTPLARQFTATARDTVAALREQSCEAFLRVANRRLGPGTLPAQQACRTVTAPGSLGALVRESRRSELIALGGNEFYAFYALPTRRAFLTIVLAKEGAAVPPSIASTAGRLPAGAPPYGFVQAYQTGSGSSP